MNRFKNLRSDEEVEEAIRVNKLGRHSGSRFFLTEEYKCDACGRKFDEKKVSEHANIYPQHIIKLVES